MSDPRITPPPPERMPPASKDRIRVELRAATHSSQGGGTPTRTRWMAPALAAAAVLTVVGGVFAVKANDSHSGVLHPASGSSPTAPSSISRSSGLSPSPPVTPPTRPHRSGPTAPPKGSRNGGVKLRLYALREKLVQRPDGSIASDHFSAGGRVSDAVRAITYTFPDGHNVTAQRPSRLIRLPATIAANGVWSVEYSPTSGRLLDGSLDRIQALDPPWVAVTYTNGFVDRFPLRWPRASCRFSNIPLHLC